MVLLGFREHAAAKILYYHRRACMHLMLEKTNRIFGTGPEQIQQTPLHNSNQRTLDGNNNNVGPVPHHQCLEAVMFQPDGVTAHTS